LNNIQCSSYLGTYSVDFIFLVCDQSFYLGHLVAFLKTLCVAAADDNGLGWIQMLMVTQLSAVGWRWQLLYH